MSQVVFLFLLIFSHLLYANLQIWAYKDRVWTWENNYKEGHYVQLGEKLSLNSKLDLRTVDSYVALLNFESTKIIEIKGNVVCNQQQLKELETKALQLPSMSMDLIEYKKHIYRGCRCLLKNDVYIYPVDINTIELDKQEDFFLHYEIKDVKKDILFQIQDLMDMTLYEKTISIQDSVGELLVPLSQITQAYHYKLILRSGVKHEEKIVAIKKAIPQKDTLKNYLSNLNLSLAESVYLMIWAYQNNLIVEGYQLFQKNGDLSLYKGFDTYYQELHQFYVKEKE